MLLMATEATAQLGGLRGRVVDEEGNPLEGVEVAIDLVGGGRSFNTKSKSGGDYMRAGIKPGTYEVTFRLEGFETGRANVKIGSGRPMEMGNTTLNKLPEGVLGEQAHARASAALEEATAASTEGDFETTIANLRKFLEEVPDSGEAYFNIGAAYEQMGDMDQALENYEKACELNTSLYLSWVAVSDIYKARQEWVKAMDALGHALESRPNEIIYRFNYGAYALNAGNMDAAEDAFRKLIETHPDHAMSHYQLGLVMVGQGNNEEGITHLEKYLELDPQGANVPVAKELLQTLKQTG
jgi:tetratricopeptide (TPR) repeat protein